MSHPDSFLEEVTEEVRRDRLIRFLRRNAVWIAAALILIIGAAALNEWQKARARAAAEARGDALFAALEAETPAERRAALADIEVPGDDGAAFLALHRAIAALAEGDRAAAADLLRGVASSADVSPGMRDVSRLKLVATTHDSLGAEERLDILDQLIVEGHALRALALEQRAMIRLAQGDRTAAVADLTTIADDGAAQEPVRNRAEDMLMVLGADRPDFGAHDG